MGGRQAGRQAGGPSKPMGVDRPSPPDRSWLHVEVHYYTQSAERYPLVNLNSLAPDFVHDSGRPRGGSNDDGEMDKHHEKRNDESIHQKHRS